MSKKAPWIRWFTSDWIAATSHLGPLEEGVYSKLIHHYYLTRKPLPIDLDRLCMIARATEPASRRAVEYVTAGFFHRSEDPEFGMCLRHPRADEEIAYSDSKHLEALSKGLKTAWLRHGSEETKAQLETLGFDVPIRKVSSTGSSTTSTTTRQLPKNQNQNQNKEGKTHARTRTRKTPTKIDPNFWPDERNLERFGTLPRNEIERIVKFVFVDWAVRTEKLAADWQLTFARNPVVKDEIKKAQANSTPTPTRKNLSDYQD